MMSRRKLELDFGIDVKKKSFFSSVFLESCLFYLLLLLSLCNDSRKGGDCEDLPRVGIQIYTRVRIYSLVWAQVSGYH